MADLGEVGGLVADEKDRGDRVGGLELDVGVTRAASALSKRRWLLVSAGQPFTGVV